MVFAKILGLIDLAAVITILLITFIPERFIVWVAMFLILKGFMFATMKNYVSIMDIVCGIYIVMMSHGLSHWLPTTATLIFLGQKAALSMV